MKSEMTAGEAAGKLEWLAEHILADDCMNMPDCKQAAEMAVSILRRVESGELRGVIHANWKIDEYGHKCSRCNEYLTDEQYEYGDKRFCPSCGALIDEKDDSHE